jgi:hypothetical protein
MASQFATELGGTATTRMKVERGERGVTVTDPDGAQIQLSPNTFRQLVLLRGKADNNAMEPIDKESARLAERIPLEAREVAARQKVDQPGRSLSENVRRTEGATGARLPKNSRAIVRMMRDRYSDEDPIAPEDYNPPAEEMTPRALRDGGRRR